MSQINETAIKTPGVYVTEIPSFPPSIAQVATAIPVFVGYTQQATVNGQSMIRQAVRISSLVQFTTYFGQGPANLAANVTLDSNNNPINVSITPTFQLYNAVRLFFIHGGSACYILSVGLYTTAGAPQLIDFVPAASDSCFDVIQKEDEITLIVIPDAVTLGQFDFNNLMTTSLQLCATLEDRFTILDIWNGWKDRTFDNADVITVFRNGVGGSNLNYGAAYYPWLNTSLPVTFSYQSINLLKGTPPAATTLAAVVTGNSAIAQIVNAVHDQTAVVTPFITPIGTAYAALPLVGTSADVAARLTYLKNLLTGFIGLNGSFTDKASAYSGIPVGSTLQEIHSSYIQPGTGGATPVLSTIEQIMSSLVLIDSSFPNPIPPGTAAVALGDVHATDFGAQYLTGGAPAVNVAIYNTPPATPPASEAQAVTNILPSLQSAYNSLINLITSFNNAVTNRINGLDLQIVATSPVYANIRTAITNAGVLVPPCGVIAGVYASVDGTRGVWKSPANVALQYVINPAVDIDSAMQEDLNIDTNAGKSVNAIRSFTGQGTLVWGARTLDGNSNDWRYISVRRLYIMVEASVKNAAFSFVFEPNDAKTWAKVRAMIENYLTVLWRQGALAGAKPEQAFYVSVGLGQTMTFDDILNGRMIIEIGMAPVRPAEFIILRFTQIQQTS